jgi:hypothetical protein
MGKALKLPLEQTRVAGNSKWVRCDVELPVCSRRPATNPQIWAGEPVLFDPKQGGGSLSFEGLRSLKALLFKGMTLPVNGSAE